MRVATFNVRHAVPPGSWWPEHRRLVDLCAGLDADVLALQEVDVRAVRTAFAHQPRRVAAAVGGTATFVRNWGFPGWGSFGGALVVRGRTVRSRVVELPSAGSRPRRAVLAELEVDGAPVTVAAAHLDERRGPPGGEPPAREQLRRLLDHLVAGPGPHVLAGDLNLTPRDATDLLDAAGLRRVAAPPTHPAWAPERHIDWIAVGPGLHITGAEVVPVIWSDHRPLVATLSSHARPG